MPNPYVIISLLLAWSITLVGYGIKEERRGEETAQAACTVVKAAELAQAAQTIQRLQADAMAAVERHGNAQAAISTAYQKDIKYVQDQKNAALAAVRAAGRVRVQPASSYTLRPGDCPLPEAAPGTPGDNGSPQSDVHREDASPDPGIDTAVLIGLASECDSITRQLGRAQELIAEDRQP